MTDKKNRILQVLVNSSLAPFWETVSRNWMMKLLCLILAFAVWQGVRESTSFETVVSGVPVSIETGEGYAVLDQSADTVRIRFRGSREDIRFVSSDRISVSVDMSGRNDRLRQTVKLSPRYVRAPSRAHAVQFEPEEITVTMDREVERLLPVKASLTGTLPEGIQVENTVCDPAAVRIQGAEQLLVDLEQVRTAPINLDGRYRSFSTHVSVAVDGQPWSATPDRVGVDIRLVERAAQRVMKNNTVRPLLAPQDRRSVTIRPQTVSVNLRGSPVRIQNVTSADIYTYIDCTDLTEPTEYEVPVRADVPSGLQVESIDPSVVQVTVNPM